MWLRLKPLLFAFGFGLLYYFFYYREKAAYYKRFSQKSSNSQTIKTNFNKCVNESAKNQYDQPTEFFKEFANCIKIHIAIKEEEMDNFSNNVFGEKKMFLPLMSDYPQIDCRWLTIGIGGVADAEKIFHEKYPDCSIFGVEPADTGDFASIGKVAPYGVGLEDTTIEMVVLDKKKYGKKNVTVLSLTSLMDTVVNDRLVHYLTIDIEGFEYNILKELVGDGKFAKDNIVFCQIDAELHNPKFPSAHESVKKLNPVDFILNFLKQPSPYIPIFNVPYLRHPHQKVTFINVVNEECEKAFKLSKYFNSRRLVN